MKPIAIYVHWPFCKSKCPYCDFNSHVRDSIDQTAWQKALLSELAYFATRTPDRIVESIFFGGGTPSLMAPETAGALIDAVRSHFPTLPDLEITLEANPTSVEADKFRAFAKAGINRVSLGVQSLRETSLKQLGREHNATEAMAAVKLARDHFPRCSFDLIYARPGQTLSEWEDELGEALQHAGTHLSLYQLTIEPGTAFHHIHAAGKLIMPEEEAAADMFERTQSIMNAHGLPAYEVSNHAKPGYESRHNLAYWRGHEYIGIGSGAHGRINLPIVDTPRSPQGEPRSEGERSGGGTPPINNQTRSPQGEPLENEQNTGRAYARTSDQVGAQPAWRQEAKPMNANQQITRTATLTHKSPERWLQQVERLGHGVESEEPLDSETLVEERIMMGLRINDGIDIAEFEAHTGMNFDDAIAPQKLNPLLQHGVLERTATHLRATPKGRMLLSSITKQLVG